MGVDYMSFRSKVDQIFIIFIFTAVLIIGVFTLLPLFFADINGIGDIILSTFIITVVFILWVTFSLKIIYW